MGRRGNSSTPATAILSGAHVSFVLHEYHHDPTNTHFGDESVTALGVAEARVFKTLVADLVGSESQMVCAVVPVAGQLNLKALAAVTGAKKATMTAPEVAEKTTGYVVGGISPLGQKRQLPVYIDQSARAHATILVSAGRRGMSVELAPDDLARLLGAVFADLARL